MPTDASIAMSVKDNLSQAVIGMKNSMTAFRGDVTKLEQELKKLNDIQAGTKTRLSAATEEVKAAKKAYQELGDSVDEAQRAAAKANWEQAESNLRSLRQEYNLVERQVRSTTREIENMSGVASRSQNRAGPGIMAQLGQAGAWQMLGQTASQWANALAGSALGSAGGNLFSGALSGAGSGAAIGSMIAPGIGTAIGAALGGAVGMLGGAAQNFESKDAAFKSYVQEAAQGQLQEMQTSITSGSATAAQRELDAIAFNRLLGDGVGTGYLSDLRALGASTPLQYSDLTAMSQAMAPGFANDPSRMLALLTGIGDAGSALGIDASGMSVMAQALSRMQSSGKANLEYLNMFQDRGVDVIGMMAASLGVSSGDIYDMISKGKISGQEAVDMIQEGLGQYSGAMEQMSKTYSGLQSTLEDARTEMDNAYGEGYNDTRKQGLQEEINWLSGESGAMLQEANRAMGAWQAELENSKEEYIRSAMDEVLNSDEYQQLMNEGSTESMAEAGRMLMEAKVRGMNEYNASEGAQLMVEYEIAMAEKIRDDASTNSAYWDAGYKLGQEFSKGYAASSGNREQLLSGTPAQWQTYIETQNAKYGVGTSNAYGLSRVPYDNYAAILHQGERVLTARQAREMDRGRASGPISVTVTGQWSVRSESDLDAIGLAIANALERKLAAGAR